ncbi:u4 tri-snrnp-associated [Nannochloropsis oceanica]
MVPDADRFKDVKIEYRDEDGRLLTTKEEFRRLNYKFHGFGSGAKKEAKRLKKIQEAEATQGRLSGAGWEALGKAQETAGQAFVVLSGSKQVGVSGLPPPPPRVGGSNGGGGGGGGEGGGGKKKKK